MFPRKKIAKKRYTCAASCLYHSVTEWVARVADVTENASFVDGRRQSVSASEFCIFSVLQHPTEETHKHHLGAR